MTTWFPKTVLLAGPIGDDSFAENISFTLTAMGIHVIYNPDLNRRRSDSRWRRGLKSLNERLRRSYISSEEKWLVRTARTCQPDFFLSPTQVISEGTLAEIKRAGVRVCAAWWGDPPANMGRIGLLTNQWDAIFIKDPDCVKKFRRIGLNAILLHEAMNPQWHKPLAHQTNDEIIVAGNFYEYRQVLVRLILDAGVKVRLYGGRLPRWVHPDIRRLHTGRYIVREEKSRIFGEGLACLNSTQIIEGNSLNCRAFEISGAGGLHLMEYRPIISECFEPGKEVLTFDSIEELLGHIDRAKRFPKEMQVVRDAASKRALAEHTYQHRLETIFKMVGER